MDASATVTIQDAATMVGMILVEPSGENRIVIATGALDHLGAEHVTSFRRRLSDADIAVVSMEMLDTALAACAPRARQGRRRCNPGPAQPLPEAAWDHIDVLTPTGPRRRSSWPRPRCAGVRRRPRRAAARQGGRRRRPPWARTERSSTTPRGARTIPAVAPARWSTPPELATAFRPCRRSRRGPVHRRRNAVRARAGAHTVSIAEVIPALPTATTSGPTRTTKPDPFGGPRGGGRPRPRPRCVGTE